MTLKTYKTTAIGMLALGILAGCGKPQDEAPPPSADLHEAALQGNLEAIREHIAAGSNLNAKEPFGGSSPLITAAAFGRTEAARLLIDAGVDVNARNNEGSTALHTAAFLCHADIVRLLLSHGADGKVRNNAGATPRDTVAVSFAEVRPVYEFLGITFGPQGMQLDYERIQAARPQIAEMLP